MSLTTFLLMVIAKKLRYSIYKALHGTQYYPLLMPVRTVYPRHPASQSRTPPFYWRGGDVLHEREYLGDEYTKALDRYQHASLELRQVEADLQRSHATLHEREGYTIALANFLDADSAANQTEQSYKRRLMKDEVDIRHAEAELQTVRAVHHPAVAGNLGREKAYLQIEIQRLRKAIDLTHAQEISDMRRLAKISVGPRYQASLDLEGKMIHLRGKCQKLRALVNKNKSDFEAIRPAPMLQSPDARTERAAYATLVGAAATRRRAEEKRQHSPEKWDYETERLFWQLELLNERMTELEMPDDQKVDINALRNKFHKPAPQQPRDNTSGAKEPEQGHEMGERSNQAEEETLEHEEVVVDTPIQLSNFQKPDK
jgi:hypothetical protein